jgi:hypothetical protein
MVYGNSHPYGQSVFGRIGLNVHVLYFHCIILSLPIIQVIKTAMFGMIPFQSSGEQAMKENQIIWVLL